MADTFTPNYNLTKPQIGGDSNTWGALLNANFDTIDTQIKANSTAAANAQTAANNAQTTASAALPKAGGTMAGPITLAYASPTVYLSDSGQTGAAGKFALQDASGALRVYRNTAAAGDYSTSTNPLTVAANDVVALSQRPTFNGATPWDSANFNPANYLPLTGGTMSGGITSAGTLESTNGVLRAHGYQGNNNTGVLFLSGDNSKYLYSDGVNYSMPGQGLVVNGYQVWRTDTLTGNGQLANTASYISSIAVAAPRYIGTNYNTGAVAIGMETVDARTVRLIMQYNAANGLPGGGGT